MILAKVCVLGEVSVGKTSLIRRYVDRAFSDQYLSTVGVKISRKLLRLASSPGGNETELQFVLWDLEGGRSSLDVATTYLKGARGAIVVGDVTRPLTMEGLQGHIDRFRDVNPAGRVVIALNKVDLLADANVPPADHWTGSPHVLALMSTSAKTGSGVDELFTALGMSILQDTGHAAHF